jgi:hypothetical protein
VKLTTAIKVIGHVASHEFLSDPEKKYERCVMTTLWMDQGDAGMCIFDCKRKGKLPEAPFDGGGQITLFLTPAEAQVAFPIGCLVEVMISCKLPAEDRP